MQSIAPLREWWRKYGEWLRLLLAALVALVGLATTVRLWLPHLSTLILAALALVFVMIAVDRLLACAFRERD